jgi:DNA-binding CsgD family transcriptional regulator
MRASAADDAAAADADADDAAPAEAPIGKTDIMRRAAEVAALTGAPERAVELTQALLAAGLSDDPLATGLVMERLGRYRWEAGDADGALSAYRDAASLVEASPPSGGQVRVMGAYARALVDTGHYADAQRVCEAAIGAGTAAGAASEVRRVRDTYGVALAFQGDVEAGLEQLVAARRRAAEGAGMSVVRPRPSRIGDVVRGYADLAAVLERAGRPAEAADVSAEGAELARSLGVEATWGSTLEIHAAVGRYHLGDWDEADRMTRSLLSGPLRGAAAARLHVVRARLETGRGSFDDADLQIEAARIRLPTAADPTLVGELAAAVAELAIWRAQLTEARDAIDDGLRRIHDGDDQLPAAQLCWLGVRAEADRAIAARDRRLTAEADDARAVATSLRAELAGIVARSADRVHLAPRELRLFPALVDAEAGRLDGASSADAWAAAAGRADEVRDPALAAYARWREAEAALAERGGKARAEAALRSADEFARRVAAEPLTREVEALARRGRLDLAEEAATPEPAATSPMDRLGLSAREQEVLALVAEGKTNRQIADELFITEKTAGHHVSNVLGKLGVASRVEAAAMAHRAGWLDTDPGEPREPSGR